MAIRRGSRGEGVRQIQRWLNQNGFDAGAEDGIFGPKTEAALKRFQQQAGIAVDGIYGSQTKAAMEGYRGGGSGGSSGGGGGGTPSGMVRAEDGSLVPSSFFGSSGGGGGRGNYADQIRAEFPGLAPYLDIPEIASLVDRAARERWSPQRFRAEVRGTNWWKEHTANQQAWVTLSPAEQEQRIRQTAAEMYAYIEQNAGFDWTQRSRYADEWSNFSRIEGNRLRWRAYLVASGRMTMAEWQVNMRNSLMKDPSSELAVMEMQRREEIARLKKRPEEIAEELYREARQNFWVPLDKNTARKYADRIINGTFSFGEFFDVMRDRARKLYPAIADRIDMGIDPGTIFAPYTAMIAEELEITPDAVILDDRLFGGILAGATTGNFPTMGQLRAQVRELPEWNATEKADTLAADNALALTRRMGLVV